ncbi:hypothetical protein Tco_0215529 [Tanacetum coccineum]
MRLLLSSEKSTKRQPKARPFWRRQGKTCLRLNVSVSSISSVPVFFPSFFCFFLLSASRLSEESSEDELTLLRACADCPRSPNLEDFHSRSAFVSSLSARKLAFPIPTNTEVDGYASSPFPFVARWRSYRPPEPKVKSCLTSVLVIVRFGRVVPRDGSRRREDADHSGGQNWCFPEACLETCLEAWSRICFFACRDEELREFTSEYYIPSALHPRAAADASIAISPWEGGVYTTVPMSFANQRDAPFFNLCATS